MASALTLARPYARAAFELARSGNSLAEWSGKLDFAAQVANDSQLAALFGSPRVAREELVSLFLPAGEAADSPFANFVDLLADNGRLPVLADIAAIFETLKAEAEKVLKVRVRTATPIDDAEVSKLRDALKRRFGSDIEIERSVDPAVLGGAIIDAGDVVIDGSVRGRLARLEQALTH